MPEPNDQMSRQTVAISNGDDVSSAECSVTLPITPQTQPSQDKCFYLVPSSHSCKHHTLVWGESYFPSLSLFKERRFKRRKERLC